MLADKQHISCSTTIFHNFLNSSYINMHFLQLNFFKFDNNINRYISVKPVSADKIHPVAWSVRLWYLPPGTHKNYNEKEMKHFGHLTPCCTVSDVIDPRDILFLSPPPGEVMEGNLDLSFSSTHGLTHFCCASILMCIKSILSLTVVCDVSFRPRPLGPRCLPYSLVSMATARAAVHPQPILQKRTTKVNGKTLHAFLDIFRL